MGSGKPKQFVRPPPKKKPQKVTALESVDDFQEAADFEEAAGGKHRAGDPVKSGRAFVRAVSASMNQGRTECWLTWFCSARCIRQRPGKASVEFRPGLQQGPTTT